MYSSRFLTRYIFFATFFFNSFILRSMGLDPLYHFFSHTKLFVIFATRMVLTMM